MNEPENLFAYSGNILRVNLTTCEIWTEPTSRYAKEWLGSSGIAIKILYDELAPWVTSFDPANRLIFGIGPLVGTISPGANEMSVSTLGPVTGGWASSHSDSFVGGQLKSAGYDAIVIQGRSRKPVYLYIKDDEVELRDAGFLWGKDTWETLDALREEYGDPELHAVSIGPAGENLVRGACIIHDKGRAFGRCGIGAVMGSKNLKAIVARGTGSVRVNNSHKFHQVVMKCREMYKHAKTVPSFRKYGTLGIYEKKQEVCGIPYKNFQETCLPDKLVDRLRPMPIIEKYQVRKSSFPGCAIGGCGRVLHITEGPYAGFTTECNQWEVLGTLEARLAIAEPTFMIKANALCNQLGIDVDLAGGAIGWAMECYQRGILTEADTGGIKLLWGDAELALDLIRKIGYREGFGDILAEGCAKAADIIGRNSSYYAMHIKGQDLYETCRGCNGLALGVMTSTRGGGHTTGAPVCETQPGLDVVKAEEVYGIDNADKPMEYRGKARMVTSTEILMRTCNSLGVCIYNTTMWDVHMIGVPELAELYSAATGWKTTVDDLERLAMKQLNLEKALNLRFTDFDRKDDMPTPRDLNEPVPSGGIKGWKIEEDRWNGMLDDYYDIHGWDRKTSYPKRETLCKLGLEEVANDLERIGKLG
jgi:aldehyde:ferredoxin oxidoreductase